MENLRQGKEMIMYGRFIKEIIKTKDIKRAWEWVRKG